MDHSKRSHLIIVCCHSIFTGGDKDSIYLESNWALKSFQRAGASTKGGEHLTFLRHISKGVQLLQQDLDQSLLVFSGGPTDPTHPFLSEARSYFNAMLKLDPAVKNHVYLEELATDSYQNVLFSIITYRKATGAYPRRITLITHAFKEARFRHFHFPAIKWLSNRLHFVGIDPNFISGKVCFC